MFCHLACHTARRKANMINCFMPFLAQGMPFGLEEIYGRIV